MGIDVEKQKALLEILGAIDGQLSTIEITKTNLDLEVEKLKQDKKDALQNCQHIDDDSNLAIAGGCLLAWCQICGKLLNDNEIKELEES
jgi:hypothetical protein